MIPFLPRRRARPDDDAHARARSLLSDRLEAPLSDVDTAWLDAHLATCADCTTAAADYESQRTMLRMMPAPEPPRDLWARTRAALEAGEAGSAAGRPERRRISLVPLGALSGVLVVGVVVGASLLSSPGVVPGPSIAASPGTSSPPSLVARPTPITVGAGDVAWVTKRDDGTYSLAHAPVDQVCTAETRPDCAPLSADAGTFTLDQAPRSIVQSPKHDTLVVVEASTRDTGGTIYVVPAPTPSTPSSSPSASPAETPSATPAPSPSPSPSPSASPKPSPSSKPTTAPSTQPSTEPTVKPSDQPSISPSPKASASPTSEPSASPTVEPSTKPSGSPEPSPSASADAPIAIAADVIVVGESAAYSPDGRWFAFAARPADGSRGPDIYVWQPGDAIAHPVTHDGRSVFATWVGDRILGSRVELPDGATDPSASPSGDPSASPSGDPSASPSGDPSASPSGDPSASPSDDAGASPSVEPSPLVAPSPPSEPSSSADPSAEAGSSPVPDSRTAVSFLLDPTTGVQETLAGGPIWRPVVDPTGRFAIYWEGTIETDPGGVGWRPGVGRLVLVAWDPTATGAVDDGSSPSPVASTPIALTDGTIRDWDVRWDETGTRFALWLADSADSAIGSLTLHLLDPVQGLLDPSGAAELEAVPALAGFSIGSGRLAWATPPGQDGEGSRLVVFAWTGDSAGQTESEPGSGDDPILVVR